MKTDNPFIDSMLEAQANVMNNWMESAKKMQASFTNGNVSHEGQNIVKDWYEKQLEILTNLNKNNNPAFGSQENPLDFFKNWMNSQMGYMKQMTDFNQSIFNSFNNFGKPANDYMSNFMNANSAWTNIYNSLLQTFNSTFDQYSKGLNQSFNKDIFKNFFEGSKVYNNMLNFFQPMIDAAQKGQFNFAEFQNFYKAEHYQNLAKQLFGDFYTGGDLKDFYEKSMKQIHSYFTGQNDLVKEYYAQIQKMNEQFPHLFNGNFDKLKDVYANYNNVFTKTFEPILKVASPGKEKENMEELIAMLDKVTEYAIRQTELQFHLQNTMRQSMEEVGKNFAEKAKNTKDLNSLPSAQDLYNEWIKTNESLFQELFASKEFSEAKGETLNLMMDVKGFYETQFSKYFGHLPVVFKSDLEELHKTIYDLKKQVKELEKKLKVSGTPDGDLFEDEKVSKKSKK
ncbi:MAG: poly(R)-hydroxyalkanoic acid synthase subunit PhaE [Bacteroidia bacterium]